MGCVIGIIIGGNEVSVYGTIFGLALGYTDGMEYGTTQGPDGKFSDTTLLTKDKIKRGVNDGSGMVYLWVSFDGPNYGNPKGVVHIEVYLLGI